MNLIEFHLGLRQAVMALMNWADMCFGKTLNWLELSNSGDPLKLMIPSYSRKAISGWNNYPGKVTSHKMNENEMGYRGSKSDVLNTSVKEQRVDGSWLLKNIAIPIRSLRCTLMGFERSYQVKIPAKQLFSKTYSTLLSKLIVNPWFLTGFADAESSFIVSIYKDAKSKLKWRVSIYFSIHIHNKDLPLLKLIQKTLGVGKVRKNSKTTAVFRVDNLQDLDTIITHFKKYPLVSAKNSDFLLFEQCYNLIKQKEHLTQVGLEKILALKYYLNKGLPDDLKNAFPDIMPIVKKEYTFKGIPNPFWISGFVSGDSTFSVSIEKSSNKLGKRIRLIFGTCLHIRDKDLLIGMANYFKNLNFNLPNLIEYNLLNSSKEISVHCSIINNTSLLQIKNNFDIENKVIPFFNKYPILGIKRLDFEDFKTVAELVKNKEHLNAEGLNKIIKIVEGMNLDRILESTIEK